MDGRHELEILAPAGGRAALEAAVSAGANAVYFGLQKLNARLGAENFAPEELADTVAYLHFHQVKAYLTLNIDLTQREVGLAARTLELARQAEVDAVLVRDPALLELQAFFPGLVLHFSTQAGISSSAGMRAALSVGMARVVLARELSAAEIHSASAVSGIETEVFVQGALCFSCSGRCLLSSWGGGRSGNRGSCASPCRVLWSTADAEAQRPLSMYDLCLAERIAELRDCGVRSLKIEGRLKTPAWVSQAVSLYRQALHESCPAEVLRQQAAALGDYTGRQLTPAFFAGIRRGITGESARRSSGGVRSGGEGITESAPTDSVQISITEDERQGTLWLFSYHGHEQSLRIPPQNVVVPKRAVRLSEIQGRLAAVVPKSCPPWYFCSELLAAKLLPRRCAADVVSFFGEFLRDCQRSREGTVRIPLPKEINAFLECRPAACRSNRRTLGEESDNVRLGLEELQLLAATGDFLARRQMTLACQPTKVDELPGIYALAKKWQKNLFALALPAVIYEASIPVYQQLLCFAAQNGIMVEVNSWDTWQLAKEAGNQYGAGPGLAVLNANAARYLSKQGCKYTTISCEIDSRQLQDLCQQAETPLLLCVFARPPLLQTRVELPDEFSPERQAVLQDSRGIVLRPRREGALTVLRPEQPYDWRSLRNPQVRVAYLQIDLCGSTDPAGDLRPSKKEPFLFNYERKLR